MYYNITLFIYIKPTSAKRLVFALNLVLLAARGLYKQ